jgi:hypothetical protein
MAAARILVPDLQGVGVLGGSLSRDPYRLQHLLELPILATETELTNLTGLPLAARAARAAALTDKLRSFVLDSGGAGSFLTTLDSHQSPLKAACRRSSSSMKVLCVGDLYFERVAVIGYVAWGLAGAPARPHLSMANIGKGQFPSDHRQRSSNECQCHFRPEIDRHFILSVSYAMKNSSKSSKRHFSTLVCRPPSSKAAEGATEVWSYELLVGCEDAAGPESACTSSAGDAISQLDWARDGAEPLEAFARAKDRHGAVVEHAPED